MLRFWAGAIVCAVLFGASPPSIAVAQDPPARGLKSVNLPMPCPALFGSPDGRYVVCVQWMPRVVDWPDKFDPALPIRIAVVDTDTMTVTAKEDFPHEEMRLAVRHRDVYLSRHGRKSLEIRSLPDFKIVSTAPVPIYEPVLVADKLLCDLGSPNRFHLPDYAPATRFTQLDPPTKFPSGGTRRIRALSEGRWFLDGLVYDAGLEQVVLLADGNSLNSPAWTALRELASPKARLTQTEQTIGLGLSEEHPLVVYARIGSPQDGESAARLLALSPGRNGLAAEADIGKLPSNILSRGRWENSARPSFELGRHPAAGQTHPDQSLGIQIVGRRILAAPYGKLWVWDLSDEQFARARSGIQLTEFTTTAAFEGITPVHFKFAGGKPPYSARLDHYTGTPIHLSGQEGQFDLSLPELHVGQAALISRLKQSYQLGRPEEFQKNVAQGAALYERVTGHPPKGVPLAFQVPLQVYDMEGEGTTCRPFVLVDIPASVYESSLNEERDREARERAARDADLKESQAQAAIRTQQSRIPSPPPPVPLTEQQLQQLTAQRFGLGLLLGGALAAATATAGSLSPLPRRALASKPINPGVLVAALGVLPLASLHLISLWFPDWQPSPRADTFLDLFVGYALPASMAFLAGMLIWSSVLVAERKGYPILAGVGLGLISPLGLLIAFLLPATKDPESQPKPTPPPRRKSTAPKRQKPDA